MLVIECLKFKNSSYQDKWKIVKQHGLCRKCLGRHGNSKCKHQKICNTNGCQYKHHYLLHKPDGNSSIELQAETDSKETKAEPSNIHAHQLSKTSILFRIIPVELRNNNITVQTYAFLDDGSSVTLMEQSIADQLNLEGIKRPLCLNWTSNTTRREENSCVVQCEISEKNNKSYCLTNIRTVENLDLPNQSITFDKLRLKYPYLRDLPIESYENAIPRILIGLNNWHVGVPLKIREGEKGGPIATKSRIGWTVYGTCIDENKSKGKLEHFHTCECELPSDENLETMLKDHYLIENMGVKIQRDPIRSNEEERALKILNETTKRVGDRFQIGLLWKDDEKDLPNSYYMAKKRSLCFEKLLAKDRSLAENIKGQIENYRLKGYIRKLIKVELAQQNFRAWF